MCVTQAGRGALDTGLPRLWFIELPLHCVCEERVVEETPFKFEQSHKEDDIAVF